MGTFKDRENYLKGLCIAHSTVAHTAARADGTLRKSFFRLNDEEELATASFQNIDYPCVGHLLLEGSIKDVDNALADIRHSFRNAWVFLQKTINPTDATGITDEIQDAYDEAFAIMEDFIKSMKTDWLDNEKCGVFDQLDLNRMNYVATGPYLQGLYGWILYFDNEQKATRIL